MIDYFSFNKTRKEAKEIRIDSVLDEKKEYADQYSKDKKTCQINFSFTDRILYKKQSDAMKEINPFSPKEWFKTNVFEVLDKNIPEKKGN